VSAKIIHVMINDFRDIVKVAAPGYRGKKLKICLNSDGRLTLQNLNWSGGTRSTYVACRLGAGESPAPTLLPNHVDMNSPHPQNNRYEGITIEIPSGVVVVEHSLFCGSDMGLTIHAHPEDVAALLPAPAAPLTDAQRVVLEATCMFKGDRYELARSSAYLPELQPVLESKHAWTQAQAELIQLGLLNRAGAVTVKGRNEREQARQRVREQARGLSASA